MAGDRRVRGTSPLARELKIAEVSKDSVTALTKDERTSYNFILSEEGILTSFSGVNGAYYAEKGEDIPTGVTEAREYVMLLKCGTEDGFSVINNEK